MAAAIQPDQPSTGEERLHKGTGGRNHEICVGLGRPGQMESDLVVVQARSKSKESGSEEVSAFVKDNEKWRKQKP
jgi:hypothetical protein